MIYLIKFSNMIDGSEELKTKHEGEALFPFLHQIYEGEKIHMWSGFRNHRDDQWAKHFLCSWMMGVDGV